MYECDQSLCRLLQLRGNRIIRSLFIPDHGKNPPALTIKIKLKNIHAAFDHFARRRAFIAAQNGRDIPEPLDHMFQLAFREAVSHQRSVRPVRKVLLRHGLRLDRSRLRIHMDRHGPRIRIEQRSVASPLARQTRTSRNGFITRRHNPFNRVHVFRTRRNDRAAHMCLPLRLCAHQAQTTDSECNDPATHAKRLPDLHIPSRYCFAWAGFACLALATMSRTSLSSACESKITPSRIVYFTHCSWTSLRSVPTRVTPFP